MKFVFLLFVSCHGHTAFVKLSEWIQKVSPDIDVVVNDLLVESHWLDRIRLPTDKNLLFSWWNEQINLIQSIWLFMFETKDKGKAIQNGIQNLSNGLNSAGEVVRDKFYDYNSAGQQAFAQDLDRITSYLRERTDKYVRKGWVHVALDSLAIGLFVTSLANPLLLRNAQSFGNGVTGIGGKVLSVSGLSSLVTTAQMLTNSIINMLYDLVRKLLNAVKTIVESAGSLMKAATNAFDRMSLSLEKFVQETLLKLFELGTKPDAKGIQRAIDASSKSALDDAAKHFPSSMQKVVRSVRLTISEEFLERMQRHYRAFYIASSKVLAELYLTVNEIIIYIFDKLKDSIGDGLKEFHKLKEVMRTSMISKFRSLKTYADSIQIQQLINESFELAIAPFADKQKNLKLAWKEMESDRKYQKLVDQLTLRSSRLPNHSHVVGIAQAMLTIFRQFTRQIQKVLVSMFLLADEFAADALEMAKIISKNIADKVETMAGRGFETSRELFRSSKLAAQEVFDDYFHDFNRVNGPDDNLVETWGLLSDRFTTSREFHETVKELQDKLTTLSAPRKRRLKTTENSNWEE